MLNFLRKVSDSFGGDGDIDLHRALINLASGLEIEGRPIVCHFVLADKGGGQGFPSGGNQLCCKVGLPWGRTGDGELYDANGRVSGSVLKFIASTAWSADSILCQLAYRDSNCWGKSGKGCWYISALYLIERNFNLRQIAIEGCTIISIEPPRCMRVYHDGRLVSQILQLRSTGEWVVRKPSDTVLRNNEILLLITRCYKWGDNPLSLYILVEALYMASQQAHGAMVAVLTGSGSSDVLDGVRRSGFWDVRSEISSPGALLRFCELDGCTVVKLIREEPEKLYVDQAGVYFNVSGKGTSDGLGARHATAKYVSEKLGENGFVVVVSQDGPISWYFKGVRTFLEDKDRYRIG